MHQTKMNVSITKGEGANKKREVIGSVAIWIPTLTEIAAAIGAAEQAKDEKTGQPLVDADDGLPVYSTQQANWIQNAIANAVKMAARNKLEPQSITCKEGLKIADTLDSLTEEGQRGSGGEGLAILREAKDLFAKYVSTLGKSVDTSNLLVTLFSNRQALATQGAAVKEKMKGYVEAFAVSLTDEQSERYTRPLEAIVKGCEASDTVATATDF